MNTPGHLKHLRTSATFQGPSNSGKLSKMVETMVSSYRNPETPIAHHPSHPSPWLSKSNCSSQKFYTTQTSVKPQSLRNTSSAISTTKNPQGGLWSRSGGIAQVPACKACPPCEPMDKGVPSHAGQRARGLYSSTRCTHTPMEMPLVHTCA